MVYFEIRDQEGTIFEGDIHHISMVWDTNRLADEFFEKKYGRPRKSQHIIETWKGRLELIQVINYMNYESDKVHNTWIDLEKTDQKEEKYESVCLRRVMK